MIKLGYIANHARWRKTLALGFSDKFLARACGEESGVWWCSWCCMGNISELDSCKIGFRRGFWVGGIIVESRFSINYKYPTCSTYYYLFLIYCLNLRTS